MKSSMLTKVRSYLAERRALGFQLRIQGYHLLKFARYADRHCPAGPLKAQTAIRWACLPETGNRSYWAQRLMIVRTFAKRLRLVEPRTQVPPRHLFGSAYRRNPPHLYTDEEIDDLLNRAGQLSGRLQPHTFQTLIGLLVCSGLRISEALRLRVRDVDLTQGFITVREGKAGRTRVVPLHATAVRALRVYAELRQKCFRNSDHFFVSEKGTPLVYSTVAHKFLQLRQGIRFNGRAPRLHDFRHTLACRVLQRWQAHGKDPSRRIAVLARFLGHAHVTDTYWYFSAFPQLLADATRNLELD
jgi:integrase/recombinase XerD